MTSKIKVPSCSEDGQASAALCRPWCADHPVTSAACSSAYVDVAGVACMSVWATQLPIETAPLVVVDGHDEAGRPFDLALTPRQALTVGAVLQGFAVLGGAV